MLYTKVVNDWGETTYVPTTAGNILLVAAIVILFAAALLATSKLRKNAAKKDKKTAARLSAKQLAFCAAAVALGTLLSNIKVFSFPTGGSITLLSMLMICLPGYWFGLPVGLITGAAYGILQMLIDPYILFPAQIVLDYLLAFGSLGLSGLFANKKHGLIKGYIAAILGRFIFVVISGCLFFAAYVWEGWNLLVYSMVYNGIYIFSEAAVTVAILAIPAVGRAMAYVKKLAAG